MIASLLSLLLLVVPARAASVRAGAVDVPRL